MAYHLLAIIKLKIIGFHILPRFLVIRSKRSNIYNLPQYDVIFLEFKPFDTGLIYIYFERIPMNLGSTEQHQWQGSTVRSTNTAFSHQYSSLRKRNC